MNNWSESRLEDCLDQLLDYRGKSPQKSVEGIPVLSAKVVKTSGLLQPIGQKVSSSYYYEWMTRGFPEIGDVVLTTEGPMGEVIQLNEKTSKFALGQRIVCLRGKKGKLDNTFLRYLLTSPTQQAILASFATGTTVLGISQKSLRSIPIRYPSLNKQKAIANVLSALDDKIELNRQMNVTLEGMAQAIFRDWFIDFGPVRRKLSGIIDPKNIMGGLVEDTTKAKELAALFPNDFGDDGLPAGWINQSVAKLSKLLKRGLAPKYADQGVVVINQRCIRNNWIDFANARCHDDVKRDPKDRWLQIGDIVVNSTGVGTLGRVATVRVLPGKATADSHVTIIRPDANKISDVILALFLEYKEGEISTLGHGSTGQTELKPSIVGELEFALPSDEIQDFFTNIVNPLRCKVAANYQENQTLAETRDYLLPKLMSGEVRVGDVAVKTEIKTKLSSVVPIGGDFFDSQSLPANDNQERDSVMVAGVIQVLQKYDGVVGNVKYQKGCYFVYRLMELPTRDFEKQAAGPYNTKIKEGGYRDAITNRYIRRARKNGYSGNIPASKISQIDQLISHYGLGEALAWVKTCLKDKNRDELELWATVDYAMVALQNRKITPTADSVRTYINNEPEWAAKLQRAAFSDTKIKQAIIDLNKLFPRAAVT